MNWSTYSRIVGDVFGAPLAIEGLLAFFLESTFIGLWIFGWDRLPRAAHLASIWLVAVGTQISAFFILAANSWMQHPVGFVIDPETGRARMTDFFAVMTNSTLVVTFVHTILAAFLTAGMFVLGVSAVQMLRQRRPGTFARAARLALVVSMVAGVGVAFSGHQQAQLMTRQQPMKMAAAEAQWETAERASFSLLTIGDLQGNPVFQIRLPGLLSLLATSSLDGRVEGMNQIQARYEYRYGNGSYVPVLWVTYWSFRLMIGAGFAMLGVAALGLLLWRRGQLESSRWFLLLAAAAALLPYLANSTGWIFTEMGRQPWVVHGLLLTGGAVSPTVGAGFVAASLVGFTFVYGVLAVIGAGLMLRTIREGPSEEAPTPAEAVPSLVYCLSEDAPSRSEPRPISPNWGSAEHAVLFSETAGDARGCEGRTRISRIFFPSRPDGARQEKSGAGGSPTRHELDPRGQPVRPMPRAPW